MILITGATGQLGHAVVEQLHPQSTPGAFAVMARDPAKAQGYRERGIAVRQGDFDDPASLAQAFAGVHKLLLISSRSMDRAAQQMRVVDVAKAAGVQHIVYTGLSIQNIETSHVKALMQSHFETEDHIRASGMAYTFVRNTMYADALPEIVGPQWRTLGLALPGGLGKVPYALRREMGEATANLLLQEGHAGKTYDFVGSHGYSYRDVADALATLTGQPVPYTDLEPQAFEQALNSAGLPDFLAYLTMGTVLDVKARQYETQDDALQQLLGRAPADLPHMLREVFGLAG
jgi:NAD(P)H dehydrogenase (quinone)